MIFILERNGITYLVEANHQERPDERKLNSEEVSFIFQENTKCILAFGVNEKGMLHLKNYQVFNPLLSDLFD